MRSIFFIALVSGFVILSSCSEKTEEKIREKTEGITEDIKEKAKDVYNDMKDSTNDKDSAAGSSDNDTSKGEKYVVTMSGAKDSKITGELEVWKDGNDIMIKGEIKGLPQGTHAIHIHEKGSCNAPDFSAAGEHFNPTGKEHGKMGKDSHAGDLGNITANSDGVAKIDFEIDGDIATFSGKNSIVGKSIIVHEKEDDFKTQPSGDSGGRIACGVIQKSSR